MIRIPIILIILSMSLLSCIRESGTNYEKYSGNNTDYARGFHIEVFNNYKILHVIDPWQGSDGVHFRYVLADSGVHIPDSLSGLTLVRVPVKRIVCMSTTHIAMIGALGRTETIVGISGKEYVSDAELGKRIYSGLVRDVGAEQSLNYELIVSMNPDVILTYGVTSEVNIMVHRLKDLGIPVILNGDYLENHPLGKLEWIRFMATLYNEDEKADSLFRDTEQKYLSIREKSLNTESSPTVMTGLPWKGSWYIPGGTSFAAAFIRDAGASFLWEDAPNHEALPISMEAVYSRASSADIWINCGAAVSMSEIKNTDIRLKEFKPFQTGRVFNNTARLNPKGGNDIWESGVLNPHLILADLVKIFHPEILSDHELVYYEKME
jgi:iron complex transport system substrate-binding protein